LRRGIARRLPRLRTRAQPARVDNSAQINAQNLLSAATATSACQLHAPFLMLSRGQHLSLKKTNIQHCLLTPAAC